MPKHDKFSPKGIANRIKSKGLQKLRWYCQMCQKQCRDQNGFKCHLMSESHQRQILLFAENSGKYMNEFSRDFEKGFLDILRFSFGGKRVRANEVYQDYIKQKNHIHMNSTSWHTLTGFVNYLGRVGKCKIDHTEKGWFVQYIDQEEELRKKKEAERVKNDRDDEERMADFVQRQADRAMEAPAEQGGLDQTNQPTELIKDPDQKIEFSFGKKKVKVEESEEGKKLATVLDNMKKEVTEGGDAKEKKSSTSALAAAMFSASSSGGSSRKRERSSSPKGNDRRKERGGGPSSSKAAQPPPVKKTALDEIREAEERRKETRNRKDYWLHQGIVVKVITKKLGEKYYKKKGVVTELVDDYTGMVRILDGDGAILRLDQTHVETVLPALGRPVLVVNGAYRSQQGRLDSLDEKNFCVNVKLEKGPAAGRLLPKLPYEDVSKLHTEKE